MIAEEEIEEQAKMLDNIMIERALDRTAAQFTEIPRTEHTRLLKQIIDEAAIVFGILQGRRRD